MGCVYRAYDLRLGRALALKLHATSALDPAQLVHEATALAKLTHPNVVTVYEVGTWSGHPWVAMEYVPGGNARQWAARSARTVAEIVALYVAAGEGLAAAHAAGLVHRDFKPDNVLVGTDGRVRVADFGLARAAHEIAPVEGAKSQLVGTPAYMAPEQWRGDVVGPAADQFAFAVAMWEALTGARPFKDITSAEHVDVFDHRPEARRRVPRHVERALRRALSPRPADRWASMSKLLQALRAPPRRVARSLIAVAVLGGGAVWWGARPSSSADGCEARIDRLARGLDAHAGTDDQRARLDLATTALRVQLGTMMRGVCERDDDESRRVEACLAERMGVVQTLLTTRLTEPADRASMLVDAPSLASCTDGESASELTSPYAVARILVDHAQPAAAHAITDSASAHQPELIDSLWAYRTRHLVRARQGFEPLAHDRALAAPARWHLVAIAAALGDRAAIARWGDGGAPCSRRCEHQRAIGLALAEVEVGEPMRGLDQLAKATALAPDEPTAMLAADYVRGLAYAFGGGLRLIQSRRDRDPSGCRSDRAGAAGY